jgi:phospholipid/cholesterol/gamma-HCH transport system substrate-binding protein
MPRRTDDWRHLVPGVLCVVALAALAVGVLVFARVGALHGDTVHLYAATSQARGVARGTEVWLDGVKVGVVRDIRFRPVNADTANRLLLDLEVLERYLPYVRRDSHTQIRSGGTLLGAPVVFVSGGTSRAPPVGERDTLRAMPPQDPEGLTSRFAQASSEFPTIMANVRILGAQLRGTSGTAGALLNLDEDDDQRALLRRRAGALGRRAGSGQGTLGLAFGGDPVARAHRAVARADSLRALVASDTVALARWWRDTTLLRSMDDARTEMAIARALLAEPRGTAGRVLGDSAIVRQLARSQHELDAIIADLKARPLRYWPF